MKFKTKMGVAFLKLLLSSYLISAAVGFPTGKLRHELSFEDQQIHHLSKHVIPFHYNIKLTSDHIFSDKLGGRTCQSSTKVFISHKIQIISFHALDLFIYNPMTTLINEGNGMIHKPINNTYNSKTHIYNLHFREKILRGFYTLNMDFTCSNEYTEGFLKISYTNEQNTLLNATHFQAIGARRVFPCWDEPSFKTTFNISILHHKNYTALSNVPIRDIEDYKLFDMVWTHFHTTPIMSTYMVAIVITSFPSYHIKAKVLERQKMWCRSQSRRYTEFAQSVSQIVTTYLKTNLESLKNIPKIDYVIIPEFHNISNWQFRDGISKWGLIFYRETRITYDEDLDPTARKIEVIRLVAHEVTHHWFGNLISPSWWSFLWINDGITRLLAVDAISKIYPDSRLLDLFVVQIQHDSLHLDTHSLMKPLAQSVKTVADINALFTSVPYIKPPVIFRMVQHMVTDVIFRKGINNYLNEYQFSFATAKNLWDALQKAVTESNYKLKFDVEVIMNTWITHSHYPVLNVKQENKTYDIIISQENETLVKDRWIPISYTTRTELNFNNTSPKLLLGSEHVKLSGINSYDWIIFNLQQTGYYRVNYDLKILRRIISYLNSKDYAKIHVLNRAQIIDDLFYFVMEKKSNISLFWELKKYLSLETDYVAWYPVIKVFEYLSTFISFSEYKLEEKMYKLLPILLKKIGYQESSKDDDLINCLRQEITKWACALGDPNCRKNAIIKLEWHLANPEKNKILPWWKDWTFCKGLIEADSTVWMNVLEIYKTEYDNKILEYLTCSEDPYIIRMYLEQITDGIIILKENNHINIFLHLLAKHSKNIDVFEYILENFEKIKPRQVSQFAAITILLNHGYIEELENRILNKFKNLNKNLIITETIECKLSSRKKRLEMIQEIMSNDLITERIPTDKSTEESTEELLPSLPNESQKNQETNDSKVIDRYHTILHTYEDKITNISNNIENINNNIENINNNIENLCNNVETIVKILIGFTILTAVTIFITACTLYIKKRSV